MPGKRSGFITGGTWCVDYNMTIPRWPREESSTRILSSERRGGGSSCNFAVDMRRLDPDIPVSTIGLCGADADGDFLREVAEFHGIDVSRFQVDRALRTHRTMAFTALDNGRRTHIFEADSSDRLTPDHFDFRDVTAKMLHLGLPGTHKALDECWNGDPSGWVAILKKAQAAGLETNLEVMTIPVEEIRSTVLPCLTHLDYLVVNDYEIGALSGVDTMSCEAASRVARIEEAAKMVLGRGKMRFVAVHFPEGAVAVDRSDVVLRQPSVAIPAELVAGTNGAGDAFAAGLFCSLHRGTSIQEALALAHAAAAASLRSVDTYSSVASVAECLEIAAAFGWRQTDVLRS